MSAEGKRGGRRYSRESQQEDRSEGQVRDRFAECLPVVPKPDKPFSLTFGDSEQGAEARRAFERALDDGEPITFEQGLLPAMSFPSWHRRIYGPLGAGEFTKVEITPTPDRTAKAVRIEIESPEGPAAFSYVELRRTVQGRKRLLLTNEHQKLPVVFSFDFEDDKIRFRLEQTGIGNSLYEARDIAAFILAGAAPGSVIRVIDLESAKVLANFTSAHGSVNYDLAAMRKWRDVLDKLCLIQQRVAGHGTVSLEALHKTTAADVAVIERVFHIFREGRIKDIKSMSFQVKPSVEQFPGVSCAVRVDFKEDDVDVLGLNIPLGTVRMTVVDSRRYMTTLRAAREQANATGKAVMVELKDLPVIEEYLDWLPGNLPWAAMYEALDHLAEASGPCDGYFTRADARASGASDAVFEALLAEHKIEPIAEGVYHLLQYPHADREDLIVLWLQTDRLGVLSHETALSLHDLCDILPSHLHITLPPGWTAEDRTLATDVEIRYAEVPEAELRWIGPVPYTAPLRTVRDCIAVGVSPELIEQAIAEGIRRGLFTEADFPELARAASA